MVSNFHIAVAKIIKLGGSLLDKLKTDGNPALHKIKTLQSFRVLEICCCHTILGAAFAHEKQTRVHTEHKLSCIHSTTETEWYLDHWAANRDWHPWPECGLKQHIHRDLGGQSRIVPRHTLIVSVVTTLKGRHEGLPLYHWPLFLLRDTVYYTMI